MARRSNLGSNDAGIPYEASCAPGTYVGTYQCAAGGSAIDSAVPISADGISASGTLSLDLRPAGAHILALPPDASFSTEMAGVQEIAAIEGTLDCSTGKFTGTEGPVAFMSSDFMGTVGGTGPIQANYDDDGGVPSLVAGTLQSSPALGAMSCRWSAQLAP